MLLVQSGQGNEGAFGALYDATGQRFYSLVMTIVPSIEYASQVTESVYVEIWRTAFRYTLAKGDALSWMIRVTYDMLGHGLGQSEVATKWCPHLMSHQTRQSLAFARVLGESSSTLTRTQRDVLTLIHLGRYRNREVPQLLNVCPATVSEASSGGLLRLRQQFPAAFDQGHRTALT